MRFTTALALAVGVHAAIGAGLALWLTYGRSTVTLAKLDLSSVELSFAEEESDASPVAPLPPSPSPEAPRPDDPQPPLPPQDEPPPAPPEPDALKIPEPPPEASPKMDTPKPPQPAEERKDEPPAQEQAQAAAPQPAPRQGRVDAPPSPKRTIKPDYPRLSRLRGEEGDVVLEMRVNAHGAVDSVDVVVSSGFSELDAAAVRAVRAAKFKPAEQGGRPVSSTARLSISFRLK